MGVLLDLRSRIEAHETGSTFVSVVVQKVRGVSTGTLWRLSSHPDPEKRLDHLARARIWTRDMEVDRRGDGEYTFHDLAPAWYEAHSRSGTLTEQRVCFRVDGDRITDLVPPADYDRDLLIAAVLGMDPEELATRRADLDAELRLRDADAGLAPLAGTDRQVRYAEQVRREKFPQAESKLEILLARLDRYAGRESTEKSRRLRASAEWGALGLNEMRCVADARWWLDRSRQTGGEILAEVVGSLRAGQGVARG